MVQLTLQPNQKIASQDPNPLMGAFQNQTGANALATGVDVLLDGLNRGSRNRQIAANASSKPGFDPGLAQALSLADGLEPDPEFSKDIQRSASRLKQKANQKRTGGSLSIRAEQISIARQFLEANPGRAREILNTFEISTGPNSVGAAQISLLEDVETKQEDYEKQILNAADELNIQPFDQNGTPRDLNQIAFEVTQRQRVMDADLAQIEAAGRLSRSNVFRRDEVMKAYSNASRSLILTGEADFGKIVLELPKAFIDGKEFIDTQSDPEAIATVKFKAESLLNTMKANMAAQLGSSGSQADIDLAFRTLDDYVELQGSLLDGTLDKEEFDSRVSFLEAAATNELYRDNRSLPGVLALSTALGKVLEITTDSVERGILLKSAGTISNAMNGYLANFGQGLIENGATTEESIRIQKQSIKFILDQSTPDSQARTSLVRLMSSIVPSMANNPDLMSKALPFFADPEYTAVFKAALEENPNPGVRSQISNSIQRQYTALIKESNARIDQLYDTPRSQPTGVKGRASTPQDILRSQIRNLEASFIDGTNTFSDKALQNLTTKELQDFEEARSELIDEFRLVLGPLRQAMSNWNVAIVPVRLPEEDEQEQ